jgi:sporulation protein YlmC with PRC-barrel domain
MLQLSNKFINVPVMSLRTVGQIATAERPIINPNNLKIEGWYCTDQFSKETLILLSQDIREIIPQGFAVDDHEVLSHPEELLRLQKILELDFELIGKHVITNRKRRVGKVVDYATDVDALIIQKLYVSQPIYKNLAGGQLSIDRSQIIEITRKYVKVREADQQVTSPVPAALSA